jgi:hypothetical protein
MILNARHKKFWIGDLTFEPGFDQKIIEKISENRGLFIKNKGLTV